MTSTVMMERTGMGMPGMAMPGMGASPMAPGSATSTAPGYVMVPRCTMKFEKVSGGMKVVCVCDDTTACSMLQNLCTMLGGGMHSCGVTLNGMPVCTCNLTMGMCRCEMTDKGVTFHCTSGDAKCCEMIQACCDCMAAMMKAGCAC